MNQSSCFGSLAVETACPNRDPDFLFRHSRNARVTARPPTRANQPRHHGRLTYGRDIGLRCYRFHVVPFLFVATNSRKPKSPDAHKRRRLSLSFRPSPIIPVRLALAHFARGCSARIRPVRHAPFLTVPLNQKKFNN